MARSRPLDVQGKDEGRIDACLRWELAVQLNPCGFKRVPGSEQRRTSMRGKAGHCELDTVTGHSELDTVTL